MKEMPMYIDNINDPMGFIRSDEAGAFLAYLVDREATGAVNGSASGTISMREVLAYVEGKTGKKAVLADDGEAAPYNGEPAYSINTEKAERLGFCFSQLRDWIFELIDHYIDDIR